MADYIIGGLTLAFLAWSFFLARGTKVLDNMRLSMEKLFNLKLDGIENNLKAIAETTKLIEKDIRDIQLKHGERLVKLEERYHSVFKERE